MIGKFTYAFIFLSLVLSSCSVKMDLVKRLYNKGWHVQVSSNKADIKKNKRFTFTTNKAGRFRIEEDNLLASVQDVISIISSQEKHLLSISNKATEKKNECAEIIMRNGDIIKGQVIEVGVSEIKYKKCEHLSGPVYALRKADVFMIRYANGAKDVFKEEKPKAEEPKQPTHVQEVIHRFPDRQIDTRVVDGLGITGLTLGLTSFLFLLFLPVSTGGIITTLVISILAAIFGQAGLFRINNNPDTYMGRGFGITGLILGLLEMILIFILLGFGLVLI